MATFIDGIGASENLDTSGEIVSISGMDISSLARAGVFNWEHKKDIPAQVVGKILKAKKIFSEEDCEDERQLMFWNKCKVPYLYVMGELMDDYTESAKEVAGMFRYDADREGKQEVDIVGFSIEGNTLDKEGSLIKKSIARKCTITVANANKMALAKMVPAKKKNNNSIDELFKTEINYSATVCKSDGSMALDGVMPTSPSLAASELKKEAPKPKLSTANPLGTHIGNVGSLNVMSHAKPAHYGNVGSKDLRAISSKHYDAARAAQSAGNHKLGQHHMNQVGWFSQAANRAETREKAVPKQTSVVPATSGSRPKTLFDPDMSGKMAAPGPVKKSDSSINKALDAGSMIAAPSNLSGGSALSKEDIKIPKEEFVQEHKQLVDTLKHPTKQKLREEAKEQSKELKQIKKSKWLARAEEEYSKWDKKEQFEAFMKKRMPHLTKGEVQAIGQVMILNKSMAMEKALKDISVLSLPEKKK